ncbi:MAG: ABC transporter ATP-binding protein [Rhizobiales bacterium]|nr:ABC transporter ATP-binding protein [Hyphomicrobiales bacterium]MBN9008619.1 ABC transporter ATP-binding protein [Hyphomicrobiales bacterium]
MSAPVLELDRVTAGYGLITVLNETSIRLHAGEILTVLGANGSGKSTVLKTSAGLTRILGGRIAFAGADATRWPAHRRAAEGIGYVPQTRNVFPDLSVADNLRMGAFLRPKNFAADVEEVFALFPRIKEKRKVLARTLSGGERRMLSIGLTLLLKPRILLLDEPSSDLSPVMVDTVFDAIARIHRELAIPILLVEQNVNKALALATRVAVLVRGREALDCPVAEVKLDELKRLFMDGGVRTSA